MRCLCSDSQTQQKHINHSFRKWSGAWLIFGCAFWLNGAEFGYEWVRNSACSRYISSSVFVCTPRMLVWMYWSILTYFNTQIRHTSSVTRSGNFSQGTLMLSYTHSSTKVLFCLCSKLLFSQPAASAGETEHILKTSMRSTLTKQTTNSEPRYRNADIVSPFYPPLISFSHLGTTTVSVIVCHFVFHSAVLYDCTLASHGCWW